MRKEFSLLALDQAVSSLTTLALSVNAARNTSVADFGVFAVGYAIFWVLLGLSRSFLGEVSLIEGHEKLSTSRNWRAFSVSTSCLGGALFSAALFVTCALITANNSIWISLAFALVTPFAIIADAIRYIAFAEEKRVDALRVDVLWLAGAIIAPPVLSSVGVQSVTSAILGWGLAAAIGAFAALVQRPELRPQFSGLPRWIRSRWPAGSRFAADFAAASGIGQTAAALVPVVASLEVAAGLRAGYVIIGPLNVAYSAMIVFLIPRLRNAGGSGALPRPAPAVLGFFSVLCGLYAIAIYLVPDEIGRVLLGPSWALGSAVAPFLTAAFVFITVAQVIVQVMRLRDSAGLVVRVRVIVSAAQAVSILVGAAYFGVQGAACGSALAALVSIGPWVIALLRSQRRIKGGGS